MPSYKIYYINLDKSIQRKEFIQKQFENTNESITRISAVNGKDISEEIIKEAGKNQSLVMSMYKPSAGQLGCFLSHRNAWDMIRNQEEDFAVLLEDDALISEDFFTDLPNILSDISTDDFVDISGVKGKIKTNQTELLVRYIIPPHFTLGQIIGKGGASTLYDNIPHYWTAIDNMLRWVYKHKVSIYSTKKKYVIGKDEELDGSTIEILDDNNSKSIFMKVVKVFWKLSHSIMKLKVLFLNYLFYRKKSKKKSPK